MFTSNEKPIYSLPPRHPPRQRAPPPTTRPTPTATPTPTPTLTAPPSPTPTPTARPTPTYTLRTVVAWVSGVALVIHVLMSWVFVYRMMIGIVGTALTIGFSWWLSVFGLLGYTLFCGCPRSWTGFSVEAFVGLWDFFKLAIASGVMLSLVFLNFSLSDLVTFVRSEFGVVSLSCRRVEKNFNLHLGRLGC
ncbi:hypothetical protein Fmac_031081 [Flemingia macrophylla]|uniref:CASP-like protein n=1 Tax=Flemingia macrophylla TaxID=520843 RepID=A0ABD1L104_9FABA